VAYDEIFLEADFDKLLEKKNRLEATRTHIIIKIASLNKRIKALWKM
jgi:hypothetical protein